MPRTPPLPLPLPLLATLLTLALGAATAGCVGPHSGDDVGELEALLIDGTPEGIGVLRLLNDPRTTFRRLDIDARLDRRAAAGLIAWRMGPDGQLGTDDDREYRTIDQVDAVRWVGRSALAKLAAYAESEGLVPREDEPFGSFDGVTFSRREADAALDLANTADAETLDDDVSLNRRAVRGILAARPIASMLDLSLAYYVGRSALERIKAFVQGPAPGPNGTEIGIISDLDKTVIPPQPHDLPDPPYPGVTALYQALEHRNGGAPGDTFYVTARNPQRIVGVPAWLAAHGLPAGDISTGISGHPRTARREKVSDITAILESRPDQRFLLFGDTSHVDPEAYRDITHLYPGRIVAVFAHDVTNTLRLSRVDGFNLIGNYAEAAAILFGLGQLDEATARSVIDSARAEGLPLTDEEAEALIADHRP